MHWLTTDIGLSQMLTEQSMRRWAKKNNMYIKVIFQILFFFFLYNQLLQVSGTQVQEASKASLTLHHSLIPLQLGIFECCTLLQVKLLLRFSPVYQ